jgi:hypothetical protein
MMTGFHHATPIARERRHDFVKAVAETLAGCAEIGPGTVARACGDRQPQFLDAAPPI